MGQYYVPAKGSISGPWLLEPKHLEELNSLLPYIEEKLDASQKAEVEEKFSSDIENGRFSNLDEAVQYHRENFFRSGIERRIEFTSKKGALLKGETLREILVDPKLDDFEPTLLEIDLSYGSTNQCTISVGRRFDGDLNYKLSCFDLKIEDEVNYRLKSWIAENKPSTASRIWNQYYGLLFGVGMILALLGSTGIYEKYTPTTQEIYKEETKAILETGINAENSNYALELILKHNSNFVPEGIEPKISYNIFFLKMFALGSLLVFLAGFRPRTIIGVGKNKWRLEFNKFYINFVLIVVPSVFIVVPFYEYIKELIFN